MMQRLFSYYKYTLKPWDFWKAKQEKGSRNVLKIGFCAVFPPFPNGAAAGSYYALRSLAKYDISEGGDVKIYLLPVKNKMDKKLFSFMEQRFTTIDDPNLDVVILWCMGDACAWYVKETAPNTKTIAWQTMHADPALRAREQQTFDSIKQADLVLGVTQWAKECYGRQITHVDYLPFGVDPTLFTPEQKKKNLAKRDTKFRCLFVSRIHYDKGVMPLLDALPLILEKDSDIEFCFVGPLDVHDPHIAEIKERFVELQKNYGENIIVNKGWTGYEEIPSLYRAADVLLFPSIFEGFGIPLIEAMSSEVPCIVLDQKPMNELIINEETGFCLSPSHNIKHYHNLAFPEPEKIAEKILFLKNHEKKRKQMGKNGRKLVLGEYDFAKIMPQLLQYCKDLAQPGKG